MAVFLDHPNIRLLLSLSLPVEDYAIAGSGPLFARGWIDDPADIDVVARGDAWKAARGLGDPVPAPHSRVQLISLYGGRVEILDGWFREFWTTDYLIDTADVIHGLRFVSLAVVAATKQHLGRPRDIAHLELMRERGWRR